MKTKTQDLTGPALDWAVANCEVLTQGHSDYEPCIPRGNPRYRVGINCDGNGFEPWEPSADWSQGGPIIEREGIAVRKSFTDERNEWTSHIWTDNKTVFESGPTPLIAAMRCYVASVMGDEVEVPEELQ